MSGKGGEVIVEIIFENENLIAVNKPSGLLTIPARGRMAQEPCLLNMLKERFGKDVFTVHRLDREASGAVVFAKTRVEHRRLGMLFEQRLVSKKYAVLVCGRIDADKGRIDSPIKQYGSGRMGSSPAGRQSLTLFNVQKRFDEHTLLEAELVTGRRHQIRVHFYSIGHPVAGDKVYYLKNTQERFSRLMLHSRQIAVPVENSPEIIISAPLSSEFIKNLAFLK